MHYGGGFVNGPQHFSNGPRRGFVPNRFEGPPRMMPPFSGNRFPIDTNCWRQMNPGIMRQRAPMRQGINESHRPRMAEFNRFKPPQEPWCTDKPGSYNDPASYGCPPMKNAQFGQCVEQSKSSIGNKYGNRINYDYENPIDTGQEQQNDGNMVVAAPPANKRRLLDNSHANADKFVDVLSNALHQNSNLNGKDAIDSSTRLDDCRFDFGTNLCMYGQPPRSTQQSNSIDEVFQKRFGQAMPKEFQKSGPNRPALSNYAGDLNPFDRHLMRIQQMERVWEDLQNGVDPQQPEQSSNETDVNNKLNSIDSSQDDYSAEQEDVEDEQEDEEDDLTQQQRMEKEWIDGNGQFAQTFLPGYALALFDRAYENGVWDYDPKFASDYLPGTKRGTVDTHKVFLFNKDYIHEEHKWVAFERAYNQIWRDTYMTKVKDQSSKFMEKEGVEMDAILDVRKVLTQSQPMERAIAWFEETYGLPADLCQLQYCGICEREFKSVMPSVEHYYGKQHEEWTRQYYIECMCDGGFLDWNELNRPEADALINRMIRRYRSKPIKWTCVICNASITSLQAGKHHFEGTVHQRKLKNLLKIRAEALNPNMPKTRDELFAEKKRKIERQEKLLHKSKNNPYARANAYNRGGLGSDARIGSMVVVPGETNPNQLIRSIHKTREDKIRDKITQKGEKGRIVVVHDSKNQYNTTYQFIKPHDKKTRMRAPERSVGPLRPHEQSIRRREGQIHQARKTLTQRTDAHLARIEKDKQRLLNILQAPLKPT